MISFIELFSTAVGFFLSISIFSYLFGDNPFFRVSISLLGGATAGYLLVLVDEVILKTRLIIPLLNGSIEERLFVLLPLVSGLLLLMKITPPFSARLAYYGNPALAFLVGVGAATAIGGAIQGTMAPQIWQLVNGIDPQTLRATAQSGITPWFNYLSQACIILFGSLTTFISFQYNNRQHLTDDHPSARLMSGLASLGKLFIAISMGIVFSGVYMTALRALVARVVTGWDFLIQLGIIR